MEVNTDKLFSIEKNLQYIYGEGVKYNYITKKSYDFKGLLPIDEIDSGRMIKNNENEYSFYWSKDGYKYVFTDSNVFTIPTGTEKTFWVINNGSLRKIDRNEIESIEIQKTNWLQHLF